MQLEGTRNYVVHVIKNIYCACMHFECLLRVKYRAFSSNSIIQWVRPISKLFELENIY